MIVIPAILTRNEKELAEKLNILKDYSGMIQIDVCDGKFVKNKTVGLDHLDKIKNNLELHLMVRNPSKIKKFPRTTDTVIFHIGAEKHPESLIKKLKQKYSVGIALNPETPVTEIIKLIPLVDKILVMTVHPGFAGQTFLKSQLRKIKQLRNLTKKPIEVDGGINDKTAKLVKKAGATELAVGSYVLNSNNIKKTISSLAKS